MSKNKNIIIIIALSLVLLLAVGTLACQLIYKDPIAAGDVCEIHHKPNCDICALQSMAVEQITSGECPRCHKSEIENVCSREKSLKEPYKYLPCDNPSHPDGCQIKETYCYTNFACIGCEFDYFQSGVEVHLESREHTMTDGEFEQICTLPEVYPPEHSHNH